MNYDKITQSIKEVNGREELYFYLTDHYYSEFAAEFQNTKYEEVLEIVGDYIKRAYPGRAIDVIKFIVGGVIVSTMALSAQGGEVEAASLATSASQQTYTSTYTVQRGDTLWGIAQKYGTTVLKIQQINGLGSSTMLSVGQNLQVPSAAPDQTDVKTHYVQKGDTLWGLAQKYETTIRSIQAYNGMNSDYLSVGQVLYIPVADTGQPEQIAADRYTVKSGDTLWKIASSNGVTVTELKNVNNMQSDSIYVGQTLIIPDKAGTHDPGSLDPAVIKEMKYFPFPAGANYKPFGDNYGAVREWTPQGPVTRGHQGVDIMADEWTPLVAVSDGTVIQKGWSEYGGYRLTIQLDGIDKAVYYAHMSGYKPGIYKGGRVYAGQVIGYVGDTGYGPEGTEGKFDPHLHFGIYNTTDWTTENPYQYLKYLEGTKASF